MLTRPTDLAHKYGREAYEANVLDAADYLADPPYPVGSDLSIAFWNGWHEAKAEYNEWADRMSEPAIDTYDATYGL